MTASTFTTSPADFRSAVDTPAWLAPFGTSPIDPLGHALVAMLHAGWRAMDPDMITAPLIRVTVVVVPEAIAVRIEPVEPVPEVEP